jgi:hypothetical protein
MEDYYYDFAAQEESERDMEKFLEWKLSGKVGGSIPVLSASTKEALDAMNAPPSP